MSSPSCVYAITPTSAATCTTSPPVNHINISNHPLIMGNPLRTLFRCLCITLRRARSSSGPYTIVNNCLHTLIVLATGYESSRTLFTLTYT